MTALPPDVLAVEALDVRHGLLQAVRGVTFSLARGETLALVGANGAGKTTLLRALAGAHLPHAGRVLLNGADVTRTPSHRRVRQGVALVPEGRKLFSAMTVEENLLLARDAGRSDAGRSGAGRGGAWTVDSVIAAFPNLAPRRRALAGTLSGGEQQAVAVGRALLTNPDVLLLDELSLGLSPLAVDRVYAALAPLTSSGVAMLLVEQDLSRALNIADRVICMLEGRVVLEGRAADLSREEVTDAYFGLRASRRGGRLSVAPA